MLFRLVCVYWCSTHIVLYMFLLFNLFCQFLWIVHICLYIFVLCVPYFVSFSGLYISDCPLLFSNVYLSVSLDCTYLIALHYSLAFICQFHWIVHIWLPFLHYSITFISPVSCVPYFVNFSGLCISDCPSLFSNVYLSVSLDCTYLIALPSLCCNVYLSCVLCTLFCQFLWIVHISLPFIIL